MQPLGNPQETSLKWLHISRVVMDCWDYDKKSMPAWKGAFSSVVLFTVWKKYSVEKDSQYAKYIKNID